MLEGNSVRIRTLERTDLPLLKQWDTQDGRGDYQEFHFTSTRELEMQFGDSAYISDRFLMLLIETLEADPAPIGLIYVSFMREGLVRLGVVICEQTTRGKGYGTEATTMIVRYLFENHPLMRIEAETDCGNIPAQRVLESAGFTREGVLRRYRYHHHQWRDFVLYSVLASEVLSGR